MKREIKFRAFFNGEMNYDLVISKGKPLHIVNGNICGTIDADLQQYIGLKDKNDTEIYEGDILECGTFGKYEIRWIEDFCTFGLCKEGYRSHGVSNSVTDYCLVIGNIHQNKDLLK
jgi:uncharacterized phage protein (TIGR01671 family)